MSLVLGVIDLALEGDACIPEQDDWQPFVSPLPWTVADTAIEKVIHTFVRRNAIQADVRPFATFLRVRIAVLLYAIDYDDLPMDTSLDTQFLSLLLRIHAENLENLPHSFIANPTQSVFYAIAQQSLLSLFTDMPSPMPQSLDADVDPIACEILDAVWQQPCPKGMRTKLYGYQKNSLWKILQRELAPMAVRPMSILKLRAADGTTWYYDLIQGYTSLTAPTQRDICGGILCEDMGTGKTCICLSTIMATKHIQTPVHDRELLCDFYGEYEDARNGTTVKSLRSMAARQALMYGMDWRPFEPHLPSSVCSAMEKSPPYYKWTLQRYRSAYARPRRDQRDVPILKVYPSAGTLVVVPDNLVAQWTGEIYKHIHDQELRFLVLDTKTKMPAATEMLQYDLVLMGVNRFANEDSVGGLDFVAIPRVCECPYIGKSRIRDCKCQSPFDKPTYTSPLLQIHWKRVIVDEGHTLSSRSSRQSDLAAKLFFNALWITTGTPTQALTETANARTHRTNFYDDLSRLGVFYTDILKLTPFAGRSKLWTKLVAVPVKNDMNWALAALYDTMCRTMIRNQKKTIEHEVSLPPLHVRTVYLDFDYYQWLAHNCQVSLISLNAILSAREGPDYLFDKRNTSSLRQTVSNIRQSCTWHSVEMSAVQSALEHCNKTLKKLDEGRFFCNTRDEEDLHRIQELLTFALDDSVFVSMMSKHEVSFVVQGLPTLMREHWGWCKGSRGAYLPVSKSQWDDHCIVSGDIVIDLFNDVKATKNDPVKNLYVFNSKTNLLESTEIYDKRQAERKLALKKQKRPKTLAAAKKAKQKKKPASQSARKSVPQVVSALIASMLPSILQKTPAAATTSTSSSSSAAAAASSTSSSSSSTVSAIAANGNGNGKKRKPPQMTINEDDDTDTSAMTLYTRNTFSDVRVLCSTSSKINYLVDQVLQFHKSEKCIIFSQYFNEMQEIYLALKLVNVRVLMYTHTQMATKDRAQTIVTFNTSENANVILMAVQRAAYGIDLSSASRVYFVSPVWHAAMEQQAIKRAHRIGQTKPVYVEILTMRHSIEDAVLKRRKKVPEQDQGNMSSDFYNDKRLKDSLNHVNFVPTPPHVLQDGDGKFSQPVMILDRPIWFMPRDNEENDDAAVANDHQNSKKEQDDAFPAVDVGADDISATQHTPMIIDLEADASSAASSPLSSASIVSPAPILQHQKKEPSVITIDIDDSDDNDVEIIPKPGKRTVRFASP
ncbi:SNF2 family N-terminal domain-containing protein [Gongronella butleri]|nr:SNF2 family N-terminal domain-containing protein [Gongronella butleri]